MAPNTERKAKTINRAKVWWLEVVPTYDGHRATIAAARAVRVSDGRALAWDGGDVLGDVIQSLTNAGAVTVHVWDIAFFGGFLDYYALKNGLPTFDKARKRKGGRGAGEPCYSVLYASHGVLSARITLRRTRKTHDYGSGKIGGLHTVEYRGLRPFFGNERREDVQAAAGIDREPTAENGAALYVKWAETTSRLAGEDVETLQYMRKVYTIGGAARRRYLRTKYGKDSIQAYHKEYQQSERSEDYFRARKLLLPGMCFFPGCRRRLLVDVGRVYKWDVNSLYTSISSTVGVPGAPQVATYEEFLRDRTPGVTYIIVFKTLMAWRKKGMPEAFVDPWTRRQGDCVDITRETAMYRELYFELRKMYFIEVYEIAAVYRVPLTDDSAMRDFNNFFIAEKEAAIQSGDPVRRMVAKLYLNTINGKFAQHSKYVQTVPVYDEETDTVRFSEGELVNNWERGHFHFLRGAYIYTMARVRVMQDMRRIFGKDCPAELHHFYTDTDSIVTDVRLPEDMVDDTAVGKYKMEKVYTHFCALSQKVYYGRMEDGTNDITAAGIRKGLIPKRIRDEYGEITAPEVHAILTDPHRRWTIPTAHRVPGGVAWINTDYRLTEIDINALLL